MSRTLVVFAVFLMAAFADGAPEWCIVCDHPLTGSDDTVIQHRGRDVAICGRPPCLPAWSADPERFFRQVQARSALFDEEAMSDRQVSVAWIVAGGYVLLGTLVGAICGYLAIQRGRSPLSWFFLGLAVNVVALGALLMSRAGDTSGLPQGVPAGLRKVPVTHAPRSCPNCRSAVHPSATACRVCGAELQASVESEIARA